MKKNSRSRMIMQTVLAGAVLIPSATALIESSTVMAKEELKQDQFLSIKEASVTKLETALNPNNTMNFDYSLELTVPDSVKKGDTVKLTTVNLADFLANPAQTNNELMIDGTVVGKLVRVKADSAVMKQQDSTKSISERLAAGIKPGTATNEYRIVFNEKAADYTSKKLVLQVKATGMPFTKQKAKTTVPYKLMINDSVIKEGSYELPAQPLTKPVKNADSLVNLSNNTRVLIGNDGASTQFLGVLVGPYDGDYGKGSELVLELPESAPIEFLKGESKNKAVTEFPIVTAETKTNSDGVLLFDYSAPKLAVKELTSNKLVLTVTEGSLKKEHRYVITTDTTGVSFKLNAKAPELFSEDKAVINGGIIKSSLINEKGRVGNTQDNALAIQVSGNRITAEGLMKLVKQQESKLTRFVEKGTLNELKPVETDQVFKAPAELDGFVFVSSKTEGNTLTHYYEKKAPEKKEEKTTAWKEYNTEKDLVKAETGDSFKEKKELSGYVFLKTENKGSLVIHYYEKKTEEQKLTRFVLEGDETKDLINPVKEKDFVEKRAIPGYEFSKSKEDKDSGIMIHYYKKVAIKTEFVDEVTKKPIKDAVIGDKAVDKETITGYEFVKTEHKENGDTVHYYKELVKTPDRKESIKTGVSTEKNKVFAGIGAIALIGAGITFLLKARRNKKQ